MSTKLKLKEAWDKLNQVARDYEHLQPSELDIRLLSLIEDLQEARRRITTGGFQTVYAIGIEHKPGEFGMIAGPCSTLTEIMSHAGQENAYILEFSPAEEGHEPRHTLTHLWNGEAWAEMPF